MTLSDSAVGTALPPCTFRWGETDVILYALGWAPARLLS